MKENKKKKINTYIETEIEHAHSMIYENILKRNFYFTINFLRNRNKYRINENKSANNTFCSLTIIIISKIIIK